MNRKIESGPCTADDSRACLRGSGHASAAINAGPPASTVKLIFIHHSTGENWLADDNGGLGIALRDNNYFVSDTNYGWGPDGIGDRTDIGHWYDWFAGPVEPHLPFRTLRRERPALLVHSLGQRSGRRERDRHVQVLLPQLPAGREPRRSAHERRQPAARSRRILVRHDGGQRQRHLQRHPGLLRPHQDKLFVAVTAPPLVSGATDDAHAANARAFNNWLVNDWLAGYPYHNVAVFDFYNVLTSNGGRSRHQRRRCGNRQPPPLVGRACTTHHDRGQRHGRLRQQRWRQPSHRRGKPEGDAGVSDAAQRVLSLLDWNR